MAKVYKKTLLKKLERMNLAILGFPYKITFVKGLIDRFNVTGCAQVWGDEIQIDSGVTPLDTLSSILHEIIEVMFRKTETKYEHEIISRFEILMMMFIIENPELMEVILETAKKETRSYKNRPKEIAKRLVTGGKRKGRV
jgi:hypothetical protein